MIFPENVIISVILVEVAIIIAILLITFGWRTVRYFSNARYTKNKIMLLAETKEFLTKRTPLSEFYLPQSCYRLDLLIAVIQAMDKEVAGPRWSEVRDFITKDFLIVLARKKSKSRKVLNRLLAAEAFGLYVEKLDEEIIKSLLNDAIPMVSIYAAKAAVELSTKPVIYELIECMSRRRRYSQTLYIHFFKGMDLTHFKIVEEKLREADDPFVRVSCYKILAREKTIKTTYDVKKDVFSKNIELQLSALRYLVKRDGLTARPTLESLLGDESWEVRLTAVNLLKQINSVDSIEKLSQCLHDGVWWVRINSALALKSMGDRGVVELRKISLDQDKYAYEAAQRALQQ